MSQRIRRLGNKLLAIYFSFSLSYLRRGEFEFVCKHILIILKLRKSLRKPSFRSRSLEAVNIDFWKLILLPLEKALRIKICTKCSEGGGVLFYHTNVLLFLSLFSSLSRRTSTSLAISINGNSSNKRSELLSKKDPNQIVKE